MLDTAERNRLIDKIRALPGQIEALVSALTPEQLAGHFLAGEWNVAQNVHHLADSHMNSFIRLKLILTEEQPTVKPYDQDLWAATADGDNLAVADSLALLRGLHRRWATLFASLTESQWQRGGRHPEVGEITAESLLVTYSAHGEAHIDQILRTLAAQPR
jgi:hypothetical protein